MGDSGAGKSTLLKQLTRTSGHRLQYFSVKGGDRYTTHNLFNGILDAWKLSPPAEFENSVKEMLHGLQASHERNSIIVLLLDDVDQIPARELNLLLASVQYFNTQEVLLHVLMSAEPDFETKIPDLLHEGMQIPYSSLAVDPLLASRAQPYIQLRLNQAGHFDEFPLSEKQINTIANDASGLPGRINYLSAETLNTVYTPFANTGRGAGKSGLFSGKRVGRYLWGLLALGLIGVGLLWKSPGNSDGNTIVSEKTPLKSVSGEKAEPATTNTTANAVVAGNAASAAIVNGSEGSAVANEDNQSVSDTDEADAAVDEANTSENAQTSELDSAASEISKIVGDKASETSSSNTAKPSTPANNSTASDTTPSTATDSASDADSSVAATAVASESEANNSESAETPVTEQLEVATAPETPATAESNAEVEENTTPDETTPASTGTVADAEESTAAEISSDNDSDAELPATPEPTTEATTRTNTTSEASEENGDKVDGLESPNWVLLQDTELFTIQMSASTDAQDVQRFLGRASLQGPNSVYTFERDGTTWHALVHGLFESVPDARAAIEKMTPDAVRNQPWIRKIGSIQSSLRRGGG